MGSDSDFRHGRQMGMSIQVVQMMVLQLPCLCGSVQHGLHRQGRYLEQLYADEALSVNPCWLLPLHGPSFLLRHACVRQGRHAVKYAAGRWGFRSRLRSWLVVNWS